MPPGKKRRKLRAKKTTSTKAPPDAKKKHLQESLFDTKSWIKNVQNVKMSDYEHNGEIMEINSDEDSDDFECNLKELEASKHFALCFCSTYDLFAVSETIKKITVSFSILFCVFHRFLTPFL